MTLVDKFLFESRGAHGCRDSTYAFGMTTCCERVGVLDDELNDFYWDSESPSRSISLFEEPACAYCGATAWGLTRIADAEHVPELWRWVLPGHGLTGQPRAGSRKVRPLREHLRELLNYCQLEVPLPPFDAVLFVDAADPRVKLCDDRWSVEEAALEGELQFASRFDRWLVSGFDEMELLPLGIWEHNLVVALRRPAASCGVGAGLTRVKYGAPAAAQLGETRWGAKLEVAPSDGVPAAEELRR